MTIRDPRDGTGTKVDITDVEAALLRANALYVVAMSKKADVVKVEEGISTERDSARKTFEATMERANKALVTAREKAQTIAASRLPLRRRTR